MYPGIEEPIDIAVRFPEENQCYGFTNSSYSVEHEWGKDPDYRLENGRYLVEIQVSHTGGVAMERFFLRNDVPYGEFRLERE
jgi:hypothetical protein